MLSHSGEVKWLEFNVDRRRRRHNLQSINMNNELKKEMRKVKVCVETATGHRINIKQ